MKKITLLIVALIIALTPIDIVNAEIQRNDSSLTHSQENISVGLVSALHNLNVNITNSSIVSRVPINKAESGDYAGEH